MANKTTMLKGIDVSEWQGQINWPQVKGNIDFVIARSSFGTDRADAQFASNSAGLRANAIPHGYYAYAYPQLNAAKDEAAFALKIIGQLQAGEIVALDFEEAYTGDPVAWCLDWLQEFERLSGYKPMLYINLAMVQAHDWTPVVNNNNGLWLAEWDFNPDGTVPTTPWPVVAMRQYSDKLTVPGIGDIDGDVFYGDINVFDAYGYKPVVVPPTPTPTPPTGGNMFTLPSGQEVDLNNADSMKVCATTWDAVVNLHQYMPMSDVNAISAKLGLPADSNKDAIIAAIVQLQQDKQTAETTASNLNKQIPDLEKAANDAKTQASDWQTKAQNSDGQLYKDLYNTLTDNFNSEKTTWQNQFRTDVAVFSQLKRNNIYYLPTGTIFSYWFQRITNQAKQTVPPPLTPEDFKYADSVPPPPNTQNGNGKTNK